jgi:transposase InsO family protein
MNPREWRIRQREDPIIGVFLRSVTQKSKPDMTDALSGEAKYLLREFDHLVIRRGVLYRAVELNSEERLQLVLPVKWRDDAMRGAHDEVGHFGRSRGIAILRDRFYWPNMAADLDKWISKCERCILAKSPTSSAPLVSIHTTQPLEVVCMDYLTLECSKGGYQYLLVMTDHYTRYAIAVPTKNMSAKTTASAFLNEFVVHYGYPSRIHSDQGAQFEGLLIRELCNLVGMTKSRTTPYHPAGNGLTERLNRTLLSMLGTLDPSRKHDWKSYISPLVHAYNCTRHESTNYPPYQLMFGRQPRLAIDVVLGLALPGKAESNYSRYIEDLKEKLSKAYERANEKSKKAKFRQKKYFDMKSRCAVVSPGDRVLVKVVAFQGKHKIADKWERNPYIVTSQPNLDIPVYKVQREDGIGKVRTLHRNLLLPIGSLPIGEGTIATIESKVQTRKGSKPVTNTQPFGVISDKSTYEDIEESGGEEDSLSDSDSEVEYCYQTPVLDHSDHDGNQPAAEQSGDSAGSDHEPDGGTDPEVSDHSDDSEASDEIPQSPPAVVVRPVARRRNLSPHQPVRRSSRKTKFPDKYKDYAVNMSQTEPEWAQRAKFLQVLADQDEFGDMKGEIFKTLLQVVLK